MLREFYITKGYGAGGTYGLPIWHIQMCRRNRGSEDSWAIAPTFGQVIDTLIPAFTTCFEEVFQWKEGVHFTVNISTQPRIKLLRTGQTIWFKSAHRPDRLVGPSISHLSGTEPGLWPELAFQKSFVRVRCPRARVLQKFLEGTPEGLGNGYEQRANFPEGVNLEKNRRRIILWTEDNPALLPQYVEQIRQDWEHDPQKLLSYTRGIFTAFTRGSAYWAFSELRNTSSEVRANPATPLIMCWDLGVTPLAWVVLQKQPWQKNGVHKPRFVAIQEAEIQARGVEDACHEFIAKFPPTRYRDTPIEIDGGHDGHSGNYFVAGSAYDLIRNTLSKHYRSVTVTAERSAPEVRDRLQLVNRAFSWELFVVAKWCKNLIRSLTQSNTKPGTWILDKPKGKDPTHYADGPGYALFSRMRGLDFDDPRDRRIYGINL